MDDELDDKPEPIVSRHPTLLAIMMMLGLLAFYVALVHCGIEHIGPILSH